MENWIKEILDGPKVIGIIANVNEGKTNLINYLISKLKGKADLKGFGIDNKDVTKFSSIGELEDFTDSVIFIDEFEHLFNLLDRHKETLSNLERIFRTLTHPDSNNIIILSGVGSNFNKFISQKLNTILLKKISYDNVINGSRVAQCIKNFCDTGRVKQSKQLNLNKNEVLVYNNNQYSIQNVPYMENTDTKKENKKIIGW